MIATLEAGTSPAGLSINRQGTLALVANREEGTVSVFTIQGQTVAPAGTVAIGGAKSGDESRRLAPDGTMALVSRDGDDRISVLSIDGTKVEYTKRDLYAGLRPYGLDVAWQRRRRGGREHRPGRRRQRHGQPIDLRARPPRVVETFTVGQTPEGIKLSPDSSRRRGGADQRQQQVQGLALLQRRAASWSCTG